MSGLRCVADNMSRLREPPAASEGASQASPAGSASAPSRQTQSTNDEPESGAELSSGASSLVDRVGQRDLSHLYEVAGAEPNQSSPDAGTSLVMEADEEYGGSDGNFVPNAAVSSCNDGRSYCDAEGDIVHHTLAERARQDEQQAVQYEQRNFDVEEAPAPEPEADGTLSVGVMASVCVPFVCGSLGAKVTAGGDGSVAASVSAGVSLTSSEAVAVDTAAEVEVTNARTAADTASGVSVQSGVQIGRISVDQVTSPSGDGVAVGLHASPAVNSHLGLSRSFLVAEGNLASEESQ